MKESRFLEVFPTALFVALAVNGFAAPDGSLELSPAMAAGIGGDRRGLSVQTIDSRRRRQSGWSDTGSPAALGS